MVFCSLCRLRLCAGSALVGGGWGMVFGSVGRLHLHAGYELFCRRWVDGVWIP